VGFASIPRDAFLETTSSVPLQGTPAPEAVEEQAKPFLPRKTRGIAEEDPGIPEPVPRFFTSPVAEFVLDW